MFELNQHNVITYLRKFETINLLTMATVVILRSRQSKHEHKIYDTRILGILSIADRVITSLGM